MASVDSRKWRERREEALRSLETEKRPRVRAEAAEALCLLAAEHGADEFSVVVVRLLGDPQGAVRRAGVALAALAVEGDERVSIFERFLADADEQVRLEASGRLADQADPALRGALARALEDASFPVRFEAARGMAALRHPAGLEVLAQALDHEAFRFRALGALAELGDAEALPALRGLWGRWLLPAIERTQTAGVLCRLGDSRGVEHLFRRARKRWSPDRALAIELLGELRVPGAFECLTEIVRAPRDLCRGAAARGLGRLGDRRGVPLLTEIVGDESARVDLRMDAAEGLCLIGEPESRTLVARLADTFPVEEKSELRQMLAETEGEA